MYAFVPNNLIIGGKLNLAEYSAKRWDSINCGANQEAIGSHVFPDISQPIKQKELESNPKLIDFYERLKKLSQKSYGKPTSFRKPGSFYKSEDMTSNNDKGIS